MIKLLVTIILVSLGFCRNYPTYKQCDPSWKDEQLGTSTITICEGGSLISSIAMGLSATDRNFTPSTINKWLVTHNGYVSSDLFVWASINEFGLTFEGKVANSQIKDSIDQGKIVISGIKNGKSWVIVTGYSGDIIYVNDPYYDALYYQLNQIVDAQNGVYRVRSKNVSGDNLRIGTY